jgi:cell fate regulator YaaT (PSP1 superfamily)
MCAGKASQAELERDAANRRRRAEAKLVAKQLIKKNDLPMKVVAVDYVDSGADFDQLVVIYFSAPHRVDFRTLVGELARSLRARIDLRQIGARDAARLIGGLGNCGRELCCATFLKDFEPVSLRMAKLQDLPPNPLKISGACGRLMCCLKYEHPLYAEFARQVPAVGQPVTLEEGEGTVVAHQVPADSVLVRMNASGATMSCSRASVCGSRHAYETRSAPPEEARTKSRRRRRS